MQRFLLKNQKQKLMGKKILKNFSIKLKKVTSKLIKYELPKLKIPLLKLFSSQESKIDLKTKPVCCYDYSLNFTILRSS